MRHRQQSEALHPPVSKAQFHLVHYLSFIYFRWQINQQHECICYCLSAYWSGCAYCKWCNCCSISPQMFTFVFLRIKNISHLMYQNWWSHYSSQISNALGCMRVVCWASSSVCCDEQTKLCGLGSVNATLFLTWLVKGHKLTLSKIAVTNFLSAEHSRKTLRVVWLWHFNLLSCITTTKSQWNILPCRAFTFDCGRVKAWFFFFF